MRIVLVFFSTMIAQILLGQSGKLITYQCQNKMLSSVFAELKEDYGLTFSYATNSLEEKTVNLDVDAYTIENVLAEILGKNVYEYKVVDDNVLIRKGASYKEMEDEKYLSSIHLKGKIQNKSGLNLPLATVYVSNTPIGTFTEDDGSFDIEIPQKYRNEMLIVSYVGYEKDSIALLELDDEFMLVALSQGKFSVEEVVVVNRKKPIQLLSKDQSATLTKRQLESLTSGIVGADLSRQLQMLAGVSSHDDTSSDVKIRGSNADETLFILDGMPLYNVNHYFGIFSSLNTSYVDEVKLYKNNFPTEYGGKTAGVVEINSQKQLPSKTAVSVEANLLNLGFYSEVPLSKNVGLLLAGRTTYKNVSNTQFNTFAPERINNFEVNTIEENEENNSIEPSFKFYDINAKLNVKLDKNQRLSFNLFASNDELKNEATSVIKDRRLETFYTSIEEAEQWQNLAGAIRHDINFSSFRLQITATYSEYENKASIVNELYGKARNGREIERENVRMSQYNLLKNYGVTTKATFPIGNDSIQLGGSYNHYDIVYSFDEGDEEKFKGNDNVRTSSLFGEYSVHINTRLDLTVGGRGTYYDELRQMYFSPRVRMNYGVNKNTTFKASYGIYQQFVREFQYEYRGEEKQLWVNANAENIPVLSSRNAMLGFSTRYGSVLFDVEAYQKDMHGVLEYAVTMPGRNDNENIRRYSLFSGKGISQGIDFVVSSGYKNYDTYLSYTLSELKYSFDEIARGQYYSAEDDRTHQLKWINSYNLGNFQLNMNAIYVSGRPYTDLRTLGDRDIRDNRFLKYLPAYTRIDAGVGYAFQIGKAKASTSLSVFNVFNTQNVSYIQSVQSRIGNDKEPQNFFIGNESNLLSRTVNVSVNVDF